MNRHISITLLVGALLSASSALHAQLTYPNTDYGNKIMNLELLNNNVCADPIDSFTIKVPEFFGVSHDNITSFLTNKLAIKNYESTTLEDLWLEICKNTVYQTEKSKQDVLQNILATKQLPQPFLATLADLRAAIKKTFLEHFTFTNEQSDFITKTHSHRRFMVRSTGNEDSEDLANAGGNTTVANVNASIADISAAMGEVIASYLDEKSLLQRLASAKSIKDIEKILKPPFVPVLIQIMVGETPGGVRIEKQEDIVNIPVSGVMWTTFTDAQMKGLTLFQTAFGHNELVVNSMGNVDSYYIGNDYIVYPIINKKPFRLVPQEHGGLISVPNLFTDGQQSFAHLPSLDIAAARAIKKLGDRIEAYYKAPRDVEFVVEPSTSTIYLVQARPIISPKKNPTYIANEQFSQWDDTHIIQGTTVVIGDAQVKTISNPEELIVTKKLVDALTIYLKKEVATRSAIAAVIVEEAPALTSHEATSFRAENIPVIHLAHLKNLITIVQQPQLSLIIDPQRGAIINNIVAHPFAPAQGWFKLPIPQQLSLMPQLFNTVIIKEIMTQRPPTLIGIDQALQILTTWEPKNPLEKIYHAAYSLINRFTKTIYRHKNTLTHDKTGGLIAQALSKSLTGIVRHTKTAHEKPELFNAQTLAFHSHFITTLIKQQETTYGVNQYSLSSLKKGKKLEDSTSSVPDAISDNPHAKTLLSFAHLFFDEASQQRWNLFVQSALKATNNNPELEEAFVKNILILHEHNALPLWLNVLFNAFYEEHKNNLENALEHFNASFNEQQETLQELSEINAVMQQFSINQFENPDQFDAAFASLKKNVVEPIKKKSNLLKNPNTLITLIANNTLAKAIDIFDSSIKTLKAAPAYNETHMLEILIDHFYTMIEYSWTFAHHIAKSLPAETFKNESNQNLNLDGYFGDTTDNNIVKKPGYIFKLREKHTNNTFKKQKKETLFPSQSFNFFIASLHNLTYNTRDLTHKAPQTLEDFFTLAHQNLLLCVQSTFKRLSPNINLISLPPIIHSINEMMNNLDYSFIGKNTDIAYALKNEDYKFECYITTIHIKNQNITIGYNITLRSHNASAIIHFNKKEQKAYITLNFTNNDVNNTARDYQWELIAKNYATLAARYIPTILNTYQYGTEGSSFTWEITPQTNFSKLQKVTTLMILWPCGQLGSFTDDELSFFTHFINEQINRLEAKQIPSREDLWYTYILTDLYSYINILAIANIIPENFFILLEKLFDHYQTNITTTNTDTQIILIDIITLMLTNIHSELFKTIAKPLYKPMAILLEKMPKELFLNRQKYLSTCVVKNNIDSKLHAITKNISFAILENIITQYTPDNPNQNTLYLAFNKINIVELLSFIFNTIINKKHSFDVLFILDSPTVSQTLTTDKDVTQFHNIIQKAITYALSEQNDSAPRLRDWLKKRLFSSLFKKFPHETTTQLLHELELSLNSI